MAQRRQPRREVPAGSGPLSLRGAVFVSVVSLVSTGFLLLAPSSFPLNYRSRKQRHRTGFRRPGRHERARTRGARLLLRGGSSRGGRRELCGADPSEQPLPEHTRSGITAAPAARARRTGSPHGLAGFGG
ncbi:hypothetical protein GCM10018787_00170 [Streptomyces thermodiastaticus]|nr:hypothetical protein GCM10018787_00170 [Streptomyces thermodiastaticus]